MIMKREGLMNLWSQWRSASAVSLIQRSISALHTALRLVHTGCIAVQHLLWMNPLPSSQACDSRPWMNLHNTDNSFHLSLIQRPSTHSSIHFDEWFWVGANADSSKLSTELSFYSMLPGNKWTPQADPSSVFDDFKYFFLPRTTSDMNKWFQQTSNFNLHVFT